MKLKTVYSLIKEGSLKNIKQYTKYYNAIVNSGLFDKSFYSKEYDCSDKDPLIHYLFYGYKTKNTPSLDFDVLKYYDKYMKKNKNLKYSNPLLHYIYEGRTKQFEVSKIDKDILLEKIIQTNKTHLSNYVFEKELLVSIIILNKNGLNYLKKLFHDFDKKTNYTNYEIIVVDNNSTDESVNYLNSLTNLPLKIIENKLNKSFSEANNQGFNASSGDLILLMNNDMEPTYGWLNELVGNLLEDDNIGAVGSKLIYPYFFNNRRLSYTIQSAGDSFQDLPNQYNPYNLFKTDYLWNKKVNTSRKVIGVTGAALLTRRGIYETVGGLDEDYFYCYEDVDFCLKLNKLGFDIKYCPYSLIIHYESPTRKKDSDLQNNIKRNRKRFNVKWFNYLFKHILENRLDNNLLFTQYNLKMDIIVETGTNNLNNKFLIKNHTIEDYYGHNIIKNKILSMFENSEYDVKFYNHLKIHNLNLDDILLSLTPNVDPLNIKGKTNLLKIAWIIDDKTDWFEQISLYDYIICSNKEIYDKIPNRKNNVCFIEIDTNMNSSSHELANETNLLNLFKEELKKKYCNY